MEESAYQLLDSGHGRRLERFGKIVLDRPCAHAAWAPALPSWEHADAAFTRTPKMVWKERKKLPETWKTTFQGLTLKVAPTPFGHIGLFPEQQTNWKWMEDAIRRRGSCRVLNLFGYSGLATLFAARAGAEVCHVDASKGMVDWARENARLSGLEEKPVRWIVDDATKFLNREVRRGRQYDAIVLDPPTFGRGAQGELFKIEEGFLPLLRLACQLLSEDPAFVILSSHTPGYSPLVLEHVLHQVLSERGGHIEAGEMVIPGEGEALPLPNGVFARWRAQ